MLLEGSYVDCVDDVGVVKAKIIKIKKIRRKYAKVGDLVLVVVKHINRKRGFFKDKKKQHRLLVGTLHLGLVVTVKKMYMRKDKTFIKFSRNGIILVNRRMEPYAKQIKRGVVAREVRDKYPKIGSISKLIY